MFNDIYNNYHRHSILLKREPKLSSILSKVFFTVKKIIYKNTITQRLQQACIIYPSETNVSVNLWVKDALWHNSVWQSLSTYLNITHTYPRTTTYYYLYCSTPSHHIAMIQNATPPTSGFMVSLKPCLHSQLFMFSDQKDHIFRPVFLT